tara:strand:+ start:21612 stop:22496 length:885 start_codon:yes stop_codon:yes gene_type:complete
VYIVTPCRNAADTLDETIGSVAGQQGPFRVRYHVQDGASTDHTLKVLRRWSERLSDDAAGIRFSWSSAPDFGMYHALARGFDQLRPRPSDVLTWINSDDLIMPNSISRIIQIFESDSTISWLTGPARVIDQEGRLVLERNTPPSTEIVRAGLCDGLLWNHLQQEGTFFRYWLWFCCRHCLAGHRLAGDWRLWREFAMHANLYHVSEPLGSFRQRPGQMSVDQANAYADEIDSTLNRDQRLSAFRSLFERRDELSAATVHIDDRGNLSHERRGIKDDFADFARQAGRTLAAQTAP